MPCENSEENGENERKNTFLCTALTSTCQQCVPCALPWYSWRTEPFCSFKSSGTIEAGNQSSNQRKTPGAEEDGEKESPTNHYLFRTIVDETAMWPLHKTDYNSNNNNHYPRTPEEALSPLLLSIWLLLCKKKIADCYSSTINSRQFATGAFRAPRVVLQIHDPLTKSNLYNWYKD